MVADVTGVLHEPGFTAIGPTRAVDTRDSGAPVASGEPWTQDVADRVTAGFDSMAEGWSSTVRPPVR